MGFLEQLLAPATAPATQQRASLENPTVSLLDPDSWAESFGTGIETTSKQSVTPTTALSLSAFWASVKIISGDCSKIPARVMKRDPEGGMPRQDDRHYLNRKIGPFGKPNDDQTGLQLWRHVFTHALIWENAYVWLEWGNDNKIRNLVQLLSDRTTVVKHKGRKWVVTEVGIDEAKPRIVARPYEEVLHIDGLCIDGLVGCETIRQAREDIGNALASREFKSKFFGEGFHAGGILQAPIGAKPEAIGKMENAIEAQHTSTKKAFRVVVMRDGFKFHQTQVNAQEAQLTEIDDAHIRDTARRFLMSPARLGLRDSISYNSLDADRRDYHDTTLSYWLQPQLAQLNCKALTERGRATHEIRHDLNLALIFADASTLANIATQGIGAGWLEKDEARSWFNLPPIENDTGDEGRTGGQSNNDPPPPAPDDTDPPPADPPEDGDGDEARAHRALVAAELGRLCRRLNTHAARAATRLTQRRTMESIGRRWRAWLDDETDSHGEAIEGSLRTALTACRAAGLAAPDAGELIASYLTSYRRRLEDLDPYQLPDLAELTANLAGEIAGAVF